MKLIVVTILFTVLASGCSRKSVGLVDVDHARRAAEAFLLHADADAVLQHMESGMISTEEADAFRDFAKRWKSAKLRSHPEKTGTCTLPEFEDAQKKFRKDWPVETPYAPVKWSRQPDVVFVCHFEIRDEKEPFSGMYFVGAYRQNDRWYFSRQK
jgi:hypothetical protein